MYSRPRCIGPGFKLCHNYAPESAAGRVGARTDFREEGPSVDEGYEQARTAEDERGEAKAEQNDTLTERHLSC